MKKETNYRIEIEYKNGGLTSMFCNNYSCAVAYCEKLENEYKQIKTAIYDNKKTIRFYNSL